MKTIPTRNPANRTWRYLYGLVAVNVAIVGLIVAFFEYHQRVQDVTLERIVQYHGGTIRAAQSGLAEIHSMSDLLWRLPVSHAEPVAGNSTGYSLASRIALLADERDLIVDLQERYADPEFKAVTDRTVRAFETVLRIGTVDGGGRSVISAHGELLDELALRLRQLTRLHMAARDLLSDFERQDGLSNPDSLLASVAVLTGLGLLVGMGVVRNVTAASTEREAAIGALQESESRLVHLTRSLETAQRIARVGSWEWDVVSETARWSEQIFRNLGYEPGSRDLTVAGFYECIHPDDREKCVAATRRAIAEKSGYEIDYRVIWPDGSVHVVFETAEPVFDRQGNPITLLGTMQDITVERESERETTRLAQRLSDAQRIARLGNWEWNARTKEEWWSDEIYRIFGVEPGSVPATYEEYNSRVHPDDLDHLIASIERTQRGDAPPYVETFRILRPDGGERVVRETGEAHFDEAGELVSLGGTVQDITEQYETEAALRETTRRLEAAQAATRIGNWEWDIAANTEWWSEQQFRNYGLQPADNVVEPHRFVEFVHPDDRDRARGAVETAAAKAEPLDIEFRTVGADGVERIFWGYGRPEVDENGRTIRMVGTTLDITDRKRAAAELAKAVRGLNKAQQIAHIGSWEWDAATGTHSWSDESFRILGLEPGSLQPDSQAFLRFVHPDDLHRVQEASRRLFETGSPLSIEYRIRGADGAERMIEVQAEMERDQAGSPLRVVGTAQDITERKRAEATMRSLTTRLEEAQRMAHIGNWAWYPDANRSAWSNELFRIFGLEPGPLPPTHAYFLKNILHRDDRKVLESQMNATLRTGRSYSTEFRIVRPSGEERVVLETAERFVDEETGRIGIQGIVQDITERKKREQELREIEQRFTLAFQLSPGMTAISEVDTGVHLDVNEKWVETMGYSRDEVIGRTAFDLGVWVNPEDRARVVAMLKKDGRFRDIEVQYVTRHGEVRDFLISAERFPVGDRLHMLIVGHDITERKRIERELRESEARLNAFFAAAPAGLALYDREGRYVKINETLAATHGRPLKAHLGKRPSEVLPLEFARLIEEGNRSAIERGERVVNEEVSAPLPGAKDGMINCVFSRFPILDESGEPSGVGVVTVDISELKKTQKELSRLNAELEQRIERRTTELRAAQDELVRRERLATLGQLTATVSHELRNPLGAMRTSLYVIEKSASKEDERMAKAIARVNRSITRCDNIIDELLDFTRIRDLQFRDLPVDSWLHALLDEQTVPDGISVRSKLAAAGVQVPADADRLRRAVINVYENACQAMVDSAQPRGGHKLTVATRAVGNRLEIIFEDTGPGIAKDSLGRIFEPLFSTKNFGVGLGLPVVRQIMEQHGGGIEAGNRRNRGAKFVLWLPQERQMEITEA